MRRTLAIVLTALFLMAAPLVAASASETQPAPPSEPPDDIDPHRADPSPEVGAAAATVRSMRFPVRGTASYVDTFGACRDGCSRRHMGIDIFGPRLQPLLAAADGHITYARTDAGGSAGNGLAVTDAQGWRFLYLHINNDTPGTDDGANPSQWRFAPGIGLGTKVYAGQFIAYLGDSGNAESTPPHVHFELRQPDGVTINPYQSLLGASHAPPDPRLFIFETLRWGGADDHIRWATTSSTVLACDMDGDGRDEPVAHRGAGFTWATSAQDLAPSHSIPYGRPGDLPLCGDWDGDGKDTIGVRRGQTFLLRNTNSAGAADISFGFGVASDLPIAGDWDGDGVEEVGVVRNAAWHLAGSHAAGPAMTSFIYGRPGDVPIAGDWDGDGAAGPGVRRGRSTMVRDATSGGSAALTIVVGDPADLPIVAHWADPASTGDSVSLWRPRPT